MSSSSRKRQRDSSGDHDLFAVPRSRGPNSRKQRRIDPNAQDIFAQGKMKQRVRMSNRAEISKIEPKGNLRTTTAQDLAFAELLDQFDKEQLRRYEHFRRSSLPKRKVQKFMAEVLAGTGVGPRGLAGESASSARSGAAEGGFGSIATNNRGLEECAIVMAGITKIFVGGLVENARMIMEDRGEKGPLCPRHIREAWRRELNLGRLPYKKRP